MNAYETLNDAKEYITVDDFSLPNLFEWIEGYSPVERVKFAVFCSNLIMDLSINKEKAAKVAVNTAASWTVDPSPENQAACMEAYDKACNLVKCAEEAREDAKSVVEEHCSIKASRLSLAANLHCLVAKTGQNAALAAACHDHNDICLGNAAMSAYNAALAAEAARACVPDMYAVANSEAILNSINVMQKMIDYILAKYEGKENA